MQIVCEVKPMRKYKTGQTIVATKNLTYVPNGHSENAIQIPKDTEFVIKNAKHFSEEGIECSCYEIYSEKENLTLEVWNDVGNEYANDNFAEIAMERK